jgi:hypothetical protein
MVKMKITAVITAIIKKKEKEGTNSVCANIKTSRKKLNSWKMQ